VVFVRFGWLSALFRVRVTLAYAVALAAMTTALVVLGPHVRDRVISHASTNLHNLSHGHLGTLLGSAFVIDAGPIYVWLPGLVSLLAIAELQWHSMRLVVAFAVGHIGATLVVALGLTAAVAAGWLPVSTTRATDVGMSYGAMAVLGTLTAAIPRRWRPAWIGWWLAVALVVVATGHDFTEVGHAVALILGMLVSTRFGQPARWTGLRYLLLVVGASFGYLVLANTEVSLLAATGLGVIGAVAADRVGRRHLARRSLAVAVPEPASAAQVPG
jgi:hypothetical protein